MTIRSRATFVRSLSSAARTVSERIGFRPRRFGFASAWLRSSPIAARTVEFCPMSFAVYSRRSSSCDWFSSSARCVRAELGGDDLRVVCRVRQLSGISVAATKRALSPAVSQASFAPSESAEKRRRTERIQAESAVQRVHAVAAAEC